jgi:hypothetical protein
MTIRVQETKRNRIDPRQSEKAEFGPMVTCGRCYRTGFGGKELCQMGNPVIVVIFHYRYNEK